MLWGTWLCWVQWLSLPVCAQVTHHRCTGDTPPVILGLRTQAGVDSVLRLQPLLRHGEIRTLSLIEGWAARGSINPTIPWIGR